MNQSTSTDIRIHNLIAAFNIDADIASVTAFGSGHINDTYRIKNSDPNGIDYLLQRVNHHVFKDVPILMQNLLYVTEHLKQKLSEIPGSDLEKEVITIVETRDGKPYFRDDDGNYWRVFHFLKDTRSYDQVTTGQQAYEGGKAFGRFQALLADMEPGLIKDTIPDFHNIESRLAKFEKAVEADKVGRLHKILPEIEFVRQRADEMGEILRLGRTGELPLRIVHNDTKFNNVLLDRYDHAQCVIDLDTVMPGYVAYDFGDSIRTIANTASEDEENVKLIGINISLFESYTKGYLKEAVLFLTEPELNSLLKGVLLLPYAQTVRFLTDYLEGDHYYKIHNPDHNLQRTRAQLTLVKKLEENRDRLSHIINHTWRLYKP
ncbi:phosphotransferase enzyme family protein [Mucilaginibacter sp. BT774]|uniref:phosphotransferase enzyme family protein n=1 Tax=Mucilaginibacter sp. BT774 TaxID=3062276 RepID=UPI002675898C|nr:aminoglycoside phosphotransferase family protein [Mucilaginibacter sp. BT774]MDO3627828.1 aminoglycoside phosphotransferase family protein [Mucilaginibacter sp. BT774]